MPSENILNGSVVLVKALSQHELWLAEPFNRAQAWVDLLLLANDRPRTLRLRGVQVEVDRGSLAWSTVSLAARWRWCRPKVSGFLEWLSQQGMIRLQQDNVTTLITITNYASYQGKNDPDLTPDLTADLTAEQTASLTPDLTAEFTQKVEGGSKKRELPPSAHAEGFVIPTEAEVVAWAAAHAEPALGVTAVPEAWARGWLNWRMERPNAFPQPWRDDAARRFRADFQDRHPKAMGQKNGAKAGGAAAALTATLNEL